jgi:hypothetical protein
MSAIALTLAGEHQAAAAQVRGERLDAGARWDVGGGAGEDGRPARPGPEGLE